MMRRCDLRAPAAADAVPPPLAPVCAGTVHRYIRDGEHAAVTSGYLPVLLSRYVPVGYEEVLRSILREIPVTGIRPMSRKRNAPVFSVKSGEPVLICRQPCRPFFPGVSCIEKIPAAVFTGMKNQSCPVMKCFQNLKMFLAPFHHSKKPLVSTPVSYTHLTLPTKLEV